MQRRTSARRGDLASYARSSYRHEDLEYDVFRKGTGPSVIVATELPGISPQVVGFADHVVDLGCSVALPNLFGNEPRDPDAGSFASRSLYLWRAIARVCIRREFTMFAIGGSSPVVGWLRALARHEHARCGGRGVGVVGMCFSGGFALAMAVEPSVLAPVMSQPSLPAPVRDRARRTIDSSASDLQCVRERGQREGLRVLGLRFHGDPLVPAERFAYLREQLGDAFVAVEIEQVHGNPDSSMNPHHSVLTRDLIDEPGEPTRAALDQVLALLKSKLLDTTATVSARA